MKSMKSKRIIVSAITLTAALMAVNTQAAVVFTDTFDSGTGSWYRAANNGTLTTDTSQLSWTEGGSSAEEVIGRSFTTQTLAVGQTLRMTLDYTQTGSTVNILRVGLYDVTTQITAANWAGGNAVGAWSGYNSWLADSGSLPAQDPAARVDSGATTSTATGPTTGTTTIGTTATRYDILNSPTTYQVLFEVTRTSLTQMDTLFTLSSGVTPTTHFSMTGTTAIMQDNFDTAVIRTAGGTALFDNIQVTFIPEPTAALLGGLGMLFLLRRSRN